MHRRQIFLVVTIAVATALAIVAFVMNGAATALSAHSPLREPIIGTAIHSKWLATGPTQLGDTVQVHVDLADAAGHPIGTSGYTCTVVRLAPDAMMCQTGWAFSDGTVETQGLIDRAALEGINVPFSIAVVGGTRAYSHLRGQFDCAIVTASTGRCTFAQH
jgi:hypothetical protein